MSIVERRARTRQRAGFGMAAAAMVVGLGYGATRLPASTTDPVFSDLAGSPAAGSPAAESSGAESLVAGLPAAVCTAPVDLAPLESVIFAATQRYFADPTMFTFEEAEALAFEWNMTIPEAKAIATIAEDNSIPFDDGLGAELIDAWVAQDQPGDAFEIAAEWNVSAPALKMLAGLGVPEATTALDC